MILNKIVKSVLSFSMLLGVFTMTNTRAAGSKINLTADQVKAKGASSHPIGNAIDGDHSTYWKTMSHQGEGASAAEQYESRMSDHNRYIDITLDGTYDLTSIKIFNQVDGSYSNYYIYASADGSRYDKIVSKTDTNAADASGDTHNVSTRAAYLRINMAYNSNSYETNLADIELYGTKINNEVPQKEAIEVTPWEESTWKSEWDKFETDQAYANEKVLKEASDLVGRVIGDKWKASFIFELRSSLNGQDVYEVKDGSDGTIVIRGNNGIALASGFNYYLKNYARVDYNPLFASNTDMKELVPVGEPVIKTTQYDLRYALNFCTYSYTMSFWNWDEYEAFIDWAAMNGVNLMLDIVGQEEVIRQLLLQYNYTDEEIKDYISGPGYFAWFYMQNLYSFGGPLPDSWFEQRVELGRRMHDRMQTYGIQPVIQGFSGQVPLTFDDKNNGAVLTPIDQWPTFTRPAIVSPYLTASDIAAGKKNYFPEMATKFYEAQRNVFGDVSHYYAADPFHEGGNTAGLDIAEIYKQVQSEMLKADDEAVWVMQQWQGNLNDAKLGGLVEPSQALALDLQSDLNAENGVMENHKVPWIWNMLHNFGGRMGLDGELEVTAEQMPKDFQNKNYMKGIGITPEALENSPVAYELFFDMTWSKDPIDYHAWLEKYAERRAGGTSDTLQEAWKILNETAYAKKGQYFQGAAETVINARPGLNFSAASTWGHSSILYDKTELDKALELLIDNYDAFASSPAFQYDLADVAEQVLCNSAVEYHSLMREAYNAADSAAFKSYATKFLEIITLSDEILSSNEEFMVGTWINDARNMLEDADDWTMDLFEFNARALITTWGGTRSNSLNDYSNRKWAGLTKSYYYERWSMWIANRQAELDKTTKNPEYVKAESNWFLWGWRWANLKSDDGYAFDTTANTSKLKENAQKAFDDYSTTTLRANGGVVEGKVNIAKGKIFTTPSATKAGSLANMTDGSTGTFWEGEGAGPHVLTLDLEGLYEITDMNIAIRQAAGDYPMDYKVEYMDENGSWQIYEPQHTGEAMQSNTQIVKTVKATQLRLTMSTRDYAQFSVYLAEVEVFGKVLEVIKYQNVALGKTVSADRSTGTGDLMNITDGDTNTMWTASWSGNKNDMYPCTLTLDLRGAVNADFIEVYFEKIGLPFQYKIEIEDAAGNKTTVVDENSITAPVENRLLKIPLQKKEVAKVYFTFTDRLSAGSCADPCDAASPGLAEIKVLSTEALAETKNYALGKPATVSTDASSGGPAAITDGNYSTFWNHDQYAEGEQGYAIVDLEAPQFITDIQLTFNKESYTKYYIFDVIAIKADGSETIILSETGENKSTYKIPVNDTISKIKVDFKGKQSGTSGWFDIAELEAFGPVVKNDNIIFNDGAKLNAATENKYQNTLDDNNNTFVNGIRNQEITYELDGKYYIDHVDLTFEKAGLGLKYVIYVENEQGDRTLVVDRSESLSLLDDATISLDVHAVGTKLIFKHLGNNGQGSAYLAEERLYETRIYGGTPENAATGAAIDPSAAQSIIDDSLTSDYHAAADTPITITFEKPSDISVLAVYTETASANYIVELYDADNAKWTTVFDGRKESAKVTSKDILLSESIFADKARITPTKDMILKEVKIFKTDKRKDLQERITEIENILANKSYNDMNGSYTKEAKAKIDAKLQEAKDAVKDSMSSRDVAAWIDRLNTALDEFYRDGLVYVDRSVLLKEINHTDIIRNEIAALGNDAFKNLFDQPYEAAVTKYNQYMITQADIDKAAQQLKTETEEILARFDILDQYRIQLGLTKKIAEEAVVGDTDGAYPQEALDTLNQAIADAETAFAAISDPSEAQGLIDSLKAAVTAFEASVISVDRKPLLALINAFDDLNQADYDIDTWSAYAEAIESGKALYEEAAVSLTQINDACSEIEAKYAALTKLDREALRTAIDEFENKNEKDYTAESWKAAKKAYDNAVKLYQSDSVKQSELDKATEALNDAIGALKEESVNKPDQPEKPDEPGKPDEPDDSEKPDESDKPEIPDDSNKPVTEYVDQLVNKDNQVTVFGKFPQNVQLIVDDLKAELKQAVLDKLQNQSLLKQYTFEKLFDIYMLRNNKEYVLKDEITVKIKLDEKLMGKRNLGVIYIDDNGKTTLIPSRTENGYIIFTTNHNSYYAIVSSENPIVNTATHPFAASTLPVYILLGAVLILVTKKMEHVLED